MKKIISIFVFAVLVMTSSFSFAQAGGKSSETSSHRFSDMRGHWAESDADKLFDRDALPFKDNKFNPDNAISRSEFALMLHKALDIKIAYFKAPDMKDYFSDVKPDAVYATALIDLVTAGIIDDRGTFRPDAPLSRQDMVHYTMKAYEYKMGDRFALMKLTPAPFKDMDKVNILYSGDFARAYYLKLICGKGNSLFHPAENATRAQSVVITGKLLDLLDKENLAVKVMPSATVKGDTLEMRMSIVNNSKKAVSITFPSGQKYDFQVLDAQKNILYTWSADKVFIMMVSETTLEAGKSLEFTETLDKAAWSGIKEKAAFLKAYVTGTSGDFNIDKAGYEEKIK